MRINERKWISGKGELCSCAEVVGFIYGPSRLHISLEIKVNTMIKQMTRIAYEAPVTECFRVEMEGVLCSASADVENPNDKDTGRIDSHEVNASFTTAGDFSAGSWD